MPIRMETSKNNKPREINSTTPLMDTRRITPVQSLNHNQQIKNWLHVIHQ